MIFLDTHAVVFLHAGELRLFSSSALPIMETEPLAISPMAMLELAYLYEIGRISCGAEAIVEDLRRDIGLEVFEKNWFEVTRLATSLAWTRDPFDRIIVAQAMYEGARLISKDFAIQEHYEQAFW
jgi:PIN domain nuclease of toxin-antitoxin system